MRRVLLCSMLLAFTTVAATALMAQPRFTKPMDPITEPHDSRAPKVLSDIGIDQKLNEQVSLDFPLVDEDGNHVQLGKYFGKRPVILALVYYECPMLCNQVMNGMNGALKTLDFNAGQEYEIVAVSFNPKDTPEKAKKKKQAYVQAYHRDGGENGWHFLTGDSATVAKLAAQVGFRYVFDSVSNQYAHASGIMVLTPEGKLSKYFYGIEYSGNDLKFAIMEASNNKIGSPVDQLLLYCYHYDPMTGKYGPEVVNILKIGGGLTIVGIAGFLFALRKRSRRLEQLRTQKIQMGGTS